jgi:hypothetical protein
VTVGQDRTILPATHARLQSASAPIIVDFDDAGLRDFE